MSYAIHILTIKLWEWEGIKEHWFQQINKSGPFEEAVLSTETAEARIIEIKAAIEALSKFNNHK